MVQIAERIALTHHERWDGSGYPMGLKAEDIPIEGRIVSVADVYDALSHDRPYKKAWPLEEAVAEIERNAGRQFDPQVAAAFVELWNNGTLTRTEDTVHAPEAHRPISYETQLEAAEAVSQATD
jgi:putative two-component system response regulator